MSTSFPVQSEGIHDAEWLISEAPGGRSREHGNLATGQSAVTESGTLLKRDSGSDHDGSAVWSPLLDADDETAQDIGILFGKTDARTSQQRCVVVVREAEVFELHLSYNDLTNAPTHSSAAAGSSLAAINELRSTNQIVARRGTDRTGLAK